MQSHVHYVHLQKKSYHYLFASHRYQLLFVNHCLSHRSKACDVRDYSYQIIDRACMERLHHYLSAGHRYQPIIADLNQVTDQ
jgi:hypothetical protein